MSGQVFKLTKHTDAEGKTRLDLEPTGCEDGKHLFTPLGKRGPRKGLPKPGQRCCCGQMAWLEEMDAMPQVHLH